MTEELIIEILTESFYTVFTILLPVLGASLMIGIFISVFQAVTSIQEMTLTFVPKILVTGIVILFLIPWMIGKLTEFTLRLMNLLATVV